MADLAYLGIKIDYSDIDKTINKLKELESISQKVESSASKMGSKFKSVQATTSAQNLEKSIKNIQAQLDKVNALFDRFKGISTGTLNVVRSELGKVNREFVKISDSLDSKTIKSLGDYSKQLEKNIKSTLQWKNAIDNTDAANLKSLRGLKSFTEYLKQLEKRSFITASQFDRATAKFEYFKEQLTKMPAGKRSAFANILSEAEQELSKLNAKTKKSASLLKEWWQRFGTVGLGFTAIYQVINLLTGAIGAMNQTILEGIKQSGELIATQSKLAMWIEFATKGQVKFRDAMDSSGKTIHALATAALTSTSSLNELATGLDELGQAGVFISSKMIPQFANLIDFTKMVSETTGSTTRQIRQELQALMQGQVKATNILIRTAMHLGILTKQDIENLRQMKDGQEAVEKLAKAISQYWGKTKEIIMSADVATVFDKWHNSLVRLIGKATELTSNKEGVINIFGATAYKHFKEITNEIKNMKPEEYSGFIKVLNAGFDKFLSFSESALHSIVQIGNKLYELKDIFSTLGTIGKGALEPIQTAFNVLGTSLSVRNDYVSVLTSSFSGLSQSLHLSAEESQKLVGKGLFYYLITRNARLSIGITLLEKLNDVLGNFYGKTSTLKKLADSLTDGLIITVLFKGSKVGIILGIITSLTELIDKFHLLSDKGLTNVEKLTRVNTQIKQIQEQLRNIKDSEKISILGINIKEDVLKTQLSNLIKYKQQLEQSIPSGKNTSNANVPEENGYKKMLDTVKKYREETTKAVKLEEFRQEVLNKLITPQEKLAQIQELLNEEVEKGYLTNIQAAKAYQIYKKEILGTKDSLKDKLKQQKQYEQKRLEATNEITDKIKQLTLSEYDYKRYQLQKEIEQYKAAGVKKTLIEKYYAERLYQIFKEEAEAKTKVEQEWYDGAINGLEEYAKAAQDTATQMSSLFSNSFKRMEDTLVHFFMTGKIGFKELINSMLADITRLAVRQTITGPLSMALSAAMSGFFQMPSAGIPGPTLTTPATTPWSTLQLTTETFATGGIVAGSGIAQFENNVVNTPVIFPFARGIGLMGEAGPEAILPLTRTSSGDLGVKAQTEGVNIQIIDQRSNSAPPVETQESTGPDGKKLIKLIIKSELTNMVNNGELDGMFKQTYGIKRRPY